MSNTMPPGRDNIPLTHPRRIARIAHLSDRDLVNEPDEVRRLVAEYRAGGPKPPTLSGAALIAVERKRQIETEGWTPEHDDAHDLGERDETAKELAEAKGTIAAFVKRDAEITAKLGSESALLDWMQERYASAEFNPHMNFYQIRGVHGENIAADVTLRGAIAYARQSLEVPTT